MSALQTGASVAALFFFSFSCIAFAQDDDQPFQFKQGKVAESTSDNPDKKLTIKADGPQARLHDLATGKPVGRPLVHDAPHINLSKKMTVYCWAFSPDGQYVATGAGYKTRDGDNEGQVCIWSITTGKRVAEFSKRLGTVRAVSFDKDNKTIVYDAENWSIDGP